VAADRAGHQAAIADYYACVTGLDFHVGRIFEELKTSGQWDNTIVVFTGDNGLSLGEHGLFGKQNLYEFGGMHVPLVVAGPGIPKGRSDALVYLMDLFPTFCELAGATPPPGIDGKSLVPSSTQACEGARHALHRLPNLHARGPRRPLEVNPLPAHRQDATLRPRCRPARTGRLVRQARARRRVEAMLALLEKEMLGYDDRHPLRVQHPLPAPGSRRCQEQAGLTSKTARRGQTKAKAKPAQPVREPLTPR